MQVYLDNAATTPVAKEVVEVMLPILSSEFGNPSSSHLYGRKAKAILETSRRTIAQRLHCSPSEIIFTSGGTEADNMAIHSAIDSLGVTHIISSEIEHHAVSHTVEYVAKGNNIVIDYIKLDAKGNIDLAHLENLLQRGHKTLVSLMHANNEIGTLLPIKRVSELCRQYNAYFHSDTVQTIGHIPIDLSDLDIDFITCAAHKLHGPKGVGFLYANKKNKTHAFVQGGSQERGLRGGTENIYGIAGMAKAVELACDHIEEHKNYVQGIKTYMIDSLNALFSDMKYHGEIEPSKSLYTVLNCSFPSSENQGMLLFSLDLKGVACSGGSACTSGANIGSHVLRGIQADNSRPNVRFSFSRFTTKEDIDYAVSQLRDIYKISHS
jgi:cysteine desulfurase